MPAGVHGLVTGRSEVTCAGAVSAFHSAAHSRACALLSNTGCGHLRAHTHARTDAHGRTDARKHAHRHRHRTSARRMGGDSVKDLPIFSAT